MAAKKKAAPADPPASFWRQNRREITFLTLFVILLGGGFTVLSVNSVNDGFVVPLTAGIAKVSGVLLNLLGQGVTMRGTQIHGPRFAVDIQNGCNGLETVVIFLAAVLSFPSPWRSRLIGVVLGTLAIQIINLVRVVALFLTGSYLPKLFDNSHTVIWQTIVIVFGVLLFLYWASRFAQPRAAKTAAEAG